MITGFLELVLIAVVVVVVYPFLKSLIKSLVGEKHADVATILSILSTIYVFNLLQNLL